MQRKPPSSRVLAMRATQEAKAAEKPKIVTKEQLRTVTVLKPIRQDFPTATQFQLKQIEYNLAMGNLRKQSLYVWKIAKPIGTIPYEEAREPVQIFYIQINESVLDGHGLTQTLEGEALRDSIVGFGQTGDTLLGRDSGRYLFSERSNHPSFEVFKSDNQVIRGIAVVDHFAQTLEPADMDFAIGYAAEIVCHEIDGTGINKRVNRPGNVIVAQSIATLTLIQLAADLDFVDAVKNLIFGVLLKVRLGKFVAPTDVFICPNCQEECKTASVFAGHWDRYYLFDEMPEIFCPRGLNCSGFSGPKIRQYRGRVFSATQAMPVVVT